MPPPFDTPDVCPACRSSRSPGSDLCENCADSRIQLPFTCEPIIPISLYRKPSPLRDWLSCYKPGNEDGYCPEFRDNLGLILCRFFDEHGVALRRRLANFDGICVVPSTTRPPPHPLTEIAQEWIPTEFGPVEELLIRDEGDLSHRHANARAYQSNAELVNRRILLIDDVFTTGAHLHSAGSAVVASGGTVAGGVVIARRLNPDYSDAVASLWQRQQTLDFAFEETPFWA